MFDLYKRHDDSALSSIPVKANKLLYILLSIIVLIVLRVWHLSVIQHEKKVEEAFRPRKKVVVEAPERGTIRDRFNVVLAANKIEYRLSVVYSQLREIPAVVFEKDAKGVKVKRSLRKEYIKALAKLISQEAGLDFERVEDLIYSHASQYDNIPFVLKANLSEKAYYRLKIKEKDFPGLLVERIPKRYYPYGRTGSHIIGYLGPIQKEQHQRQVAEIRTLSEYVKQIEQGLEADDYDLPEGVSSFGEAKRRLSFLLERAYALNDNVGIVGVEAQFEDELRGYLGKKLYFSDAKGNFVRTMPGARPALSGKRLLLSISIELQDFAERLLALSEVDREKSSLKRRVQKKETLKEPWMRGGAIVAIDPNNGEVLALASYPRFDPNDFIKRGVEENKNQVLRWIENEAFQAKVWDQRVPLIRETASGKDLNLKDEEMWLSWKAFLELLLPNASPMISFLANDTTVGDVVLAQRAFDEILKRAPNLPAQDVMNLVYSGFEPQENRADVKLFEQDIAPYKKVLDGWFSGFTENQEKLLLLDLSRLVVFQEDFSDELYAALSGLSLSSFRDLSCAYAQADDLLRKEAKKIFHEHDFKAFRKENEKKFLQEKRLKEKQLKKPHKPYLDYIDKWEASLFRAFWQKERYYFLEFFLTARFTKATEDSSQALAYLTNFSALPESSDEKIVTLRKMLLNLDPSLVKACLKALKSFNDLDHPLYGKYFRAPKGTPLLAKHLAQSFMKSYGAGSLRSYAFRQTTIQGSIFKIVTAYAGLKQLYNERGGKVTPKDCGLFEITDQTFKSQGKTYVGYFADGKAIPQLYKGGRIPKSMRPNNGRLDLLKAIELTSNPYFSLLAAEYLKEPNDLVQAAKDFGYGEKSAIELPGEITGSIPTDLNENRTGLYATAIGQHTLITTPLQTALMLSTIANGGSLFEPKIANLMIGKNAPFETNGFRLKEKFYLKKSLQSVGIDFPLFYENSQERKNEVQEFSKHVRRKVFLPDVIRKTLLEGMRRSAKRSQDEAKDILLRSLQGQKAGYKALVDLQNQFVGKTSTAEVIERVGLDGINPSSMYRHIWFGATSFNPNASDQNAHSFVFKDKFGKPELVVVVYLRFAGYGKDCAPIAAQVVQKWRQIQKDQ
jgi:cell division protein FtsI/penicillin-binding protein 2